MLVFSKRHNNDIAGLFEKFSVIFKEFTAQHNTLRNTVFNLEAEKSS